MQREFQLEEWELPPGSSEALSAPSEPDPKDDFGEGAVRVVKAGPLRWIVFMNDGNANRVVCKYFEGPMVWREPPRSDKLARIVGRALRREDFRLGRLFVLPGEGAGEPRIVVMHEVYGGDWLRPDLSYRGGSIQNGQLNGEPNLHAALLRELESPESVISRSWRLSGMSQQERRDLQEQQSQAWQREQQEQQLAARIARAGKGLVAKIRGLLGS